MVLVERRCDECGWLKVGPNVGVCPIHGTRLKPSPGGKVKNTKNVFKVDKKQKSLNIKLQNGGLIKASVVDFEDKKHGTPKQRMVDIRFMYKSTVDKKYIYSKQGVMVPYSEREMLAQWLNDLEDEEEYYEEPAVKAPVRQLTAGYSPLTIEEIEKRYSNV